MGRFLLVMALATGLAAEEVLPAVVERIRWAAAPITETAVFVGGRRMAADDWGGVKDPVQIGLSLNVRAWRPPVEAVLAYYQAQGGADRSADDADGSFAVSSRVQSDLLLQEVAPGAQVAWEVWRLRGTLGGGPAFVRSEVNTRVTHSLGWQIQHPGEPAEETSVRGGSGIGTWGALGATMGFGHSSLGVQLRHTWVRLPLGDRTVDAGGLQAGALVVFRW